MVAKSQSVIIEVEEDTTHYHKPCRLCGKTFTLGHAAFYHPVEWNNYLASRIDFGTSIFEVLDGRKVDKAAIRS